MEIKRGSIFFADLDPVIGSEQGGYRPVVIIQNDVGNNCSPTVIVAALSSQNKKPNMPTHVSLECENACIEKDSIVMLEQIRTLDKMRLRDYVGCLESKKIQEIEQAFLASIGIVTERKDNSVIMKTP